MDPQNLLLFMLGLEKILVNEKETGVKMKLGKNGSAFFERQTLIKGYQTDDALSDKNFLSEDDSKIILPTKYTKPDELFNSDKKNQTWFQSLKFWSKSSNQKKDDDQKTDSIVTMKEFQQEDTSSQVINQSIYEVLQQQPQIQLQKPQESSEITHSDRETISPREQNIEISLCGSQFTQSNLTQTQRLNIFEQYKVSFSNFQKDPFKLITNKDLVIKIGDHLYTKEAGMIQLLAKTVYKQEIALESLQSKKSDKSSQWFSRMFGKKKQSDNIESNKEEKPLDQQPISKSSERIRKMSEETSFDTASSYSGYKRKRSIKPILKPHSNTLAKFGLIKGANKITFRLCTPKKSELVELHGKIFLYDQNTKLVISDIDGTITKSDFLGQLMPKLGTEWNHEGVATLYQNIQKLGYTIMYLTARAIGQADQTKDFIYNFQQQKIKLPLGPIILSPDSLFPAFKREIIDGTPELFKISALKEIRNLFIGESPFFCGFGNRVTDATAYQAVRVDQNRIYIIDTDSKIQRYDTEEIITYVEMNQNLHYYFPPLNQDDYSQQNFWKIPINDNVDINYS